VNVKPIKNTDDLTQDFNTVLRYITKSSESTEEHSGLTPEQTMELYKFSRGQHFCDPYGVFRGIKISKSYLDIDPEDSSATGMYFQYLPDSGYNRLA
jgi:hypothetical protein